MFAVRESILSFGTGLVGGAWGTFFIARSVWQTAQAQVDDTDRYCAQLRSLHGAVDEEPPSRRVRARPVVAAPLPARRSGHRRARVPCGPAPAPARADCSRLAPHASPSSLAVFVACSLRAAHGSGAELARPAAETRHLQRVELASAALVRGHRQVAVKLVAAF